MTSAFKSRLAKGMKLQPVHVHEIEFGKDGLNTANFIQKVTELSNTDTVKNSGGFIVIRPKNGVSTFTNSSGNNNNIWDSIPSLASIADSNNILFQAQSVQSYNCKIPLMTWDKSHKCAILQQQSYKQTGQLSENVKVYRVNSSNDLISIEMPKLKSNHINCNDLDFYRGFCCMAPAVNNYK
eukprot:114349_1